VQFQTYSPCQSEQRIDREVDVATLDSTQMAWVCAGHLGRLVQREAGSESRLPQRLSNTQAYGCRLQAREILRLRAAGHGAEYQRWCIGVQPYPEK